jgi:hypothetical protein
MKLLAELLKLKKNNENPNTWSMKAAAAGAASWCIVLLPSGMQT